MPSPVSALTLDPVLVFALRGFLALLFARAAVSKLADPHAFVAAIRGYELTPVALAPLVAAAIVLAELALVLLLLLPGFGALASLAGAVLLAVYAAAIGINLVRGRRDIDCGCSGPARRQTLHELLLARNAAFIALAALAAQAPAARGLIWLDGISIAFGVAALGTLMLGIDGLAALAARTRLEESRS